MALVKFSQGNNNNVFKSSYNDLFDSFFGTDQFLSKSLISRNPAVNIFENDDKFMIELAAPGLEKEDFKINLEQDQLSVSASKTDVQIGENKSGTYNRREFSFSEFTKTFTLPETADSNKIEAEYKNGILFIHISKKEELKIQARQIAIQ